MATEVEVAAVRDALELTELAFRPKRKGMVDIRSADRTVRPLALAMLPQLEFPRGEVEIEMPLPAAVALGAISPGRVSRQKPSISICSHSRDRKGKFHGVISWRKLLPIWVIPKGTYPARCRGHS